MRFIKKSPPVPMSVPPRQFRIAFAGLLLVLTLAALDQNIVTTALPQIVADLGGLERLAWVVTAFMLTSTISAPLYGKLSDLYGRRPMFVISIVLFLAGSVLCGIAHDMLELIVYRGVEGLGAGGLITLTQIAVADLVGGLGRAKYQGFFTGVFALCSIAGPLLGGILTETLSWRWIFYVNIPFGIAAMILILMGIPHMPRHAHPRIDYSGAVLLTIGTTTLLLVLSWAGTAYAWLSPQVLGLAGVTVVVFAAFGLNEHRHAEPLLPLRLFAGKVFRVGVSTNALSQVGMFSAMLFMPLYFQVRFGAGPTVAGLMLTPLMAGVVVASMLGGRLVVATGRIKGLTVWGLGLSAVALGALTAVAWLQAGALVFEAVLVVVGVGLGAAMPNLTTVIQNGVAQRDLGVATSANALFRSIGGAFGVALAGALVNMVLLAHLGNGASHALQAGGAAGNESLARVLSPSAIGAYEAAVVVTFLSGAVVLAIACLQCIFLPDDRIVTTGAGLQVEPPAAPPRQM
ncbi:MAG TPA: MDR family MFS transporter [Nevskiaceae bacterium]|nr:MDR family MFS transporter [Nevskiaceae bacterium]